MASIASLLQKTKPWQVLRLLGACALAYTVTGVLALPEGYWAVITAIVVTQPAFDATLKTGRDRIMGTIIGAFAGFVVIMADERWGWPLETSFWVALVPLAVLTAMKPHLRLSGVTLVVMVLIPGEANWHRPLDRVLEILIGTAASIAVSLILYPRKAKAVVEKAGAEIEAEPETEVDTSVQATVRPKALAADQHE